MGHIQWASGKIYNMMEENGGRGVHGTLSCEHCRRRKQKCQFLNPNDKCTRCVRHHQDCGPKQLPKDDKGQRDSDAREKENQRALKNFAETRLQRGQSWSDILAIMDPDGSISPVPERTQMHPIAAPFSSSIPTSSQWDLPIAQTFPDYNAFESSFPGMATGSHPGTAPTSSSDSLIHGTFGNFNYNGGSAIAETQSSFGLLTSNSSTHIHPSNYPASYNNAMAFGNILGRPTALPPGNSVQTAVDNNQAWSIPTGSNNSVVSVNSLMPENSHFGYNYYDPFAVTPSGEDESGQQF